VACVKLIACENLMDQWEDHHDAPNVDCRKVPPPHPATAQTPNLDS
jgi:hypothetical protein